MVCCSACNAPRPSATASTYSRGLAMRPQNSTAAIMTSPAVGRRFRSLRISMSGSAALLLHEPRLACLYDHILIFESTHRSEIEISFAHQYDPRLSLNFGSPTIYGANVNSLSFPLEWASKPNPFYDADLWRMAIDRCEAQNVEALSAEQAVQIQVELMSVLIQTGDVPTLKKFAASRGQSTRSFSRDLERSGTNYRALTDSIRMRRAAEYLLQDQWTIERISDHLGFADPSSFRRSFRRWFGQAPSDWQRQRRMW